MPAELVVMVELGCFGPQVAIEVAFESLVVVVVVVGFEGLVEIAGVAVRVVTEAVR